MISRFLTEVLAILAVGLGIVWFCVLLHEHDVCPLRSLKKIIRKLSIVWICALALWAMPFIQYGSTKGGNCGTNSVQMVVGPNVPSVQRPLSSVGCPPSFVFTSTNTTRTITGDDFRRGFVMTHVGTDETFDFSAPPDAAVCADWRAFGTAEDWFYVAFTNWAFQVGTNEVNRLRIHSDGWVEALPADAARAAQFWPFKAPLDIAPEANWPNGQLPSRFWHYVTPSNTLQLTWQNALLDGDTNVPVSVQAEFWMDGRFAYRYDLSRCGVRGARALPGGCGLGETGAMTNVLVGAQPGGLAWATNSLPTNVTSMVFWPLTTEDAYDPDADGDGLATIDELFVYRTDPHNADTDYDGLTDDEELFVHGTDPMNPHSVSDTYSDGFALKIGGENPFACPEGSTNTVLEHVFYSGTTNGAFAYPQPSDGMAVLRVSVSGSGAGDLIVGDRVVPLVAPPQMRSGPQSPSTPLLVRVVKGETYRVWRRGGEGLGVVLDSDDFAFGSLPSHGVYGHVNFPNTAATPACIHDFNARRKRVSLPIGRGADAVTCTWDAGMGMDVAVSNIPPRSATVTGYFSARGTGGVTYELDHPDYLFGRRVYDQTVRFCPRPPEPGPGDPPPGGPLPPWFESGEGGDSESNENADPGDWCCYWESCGPSCACGCGGSHGGVGGPDDGDDFDGVCPVHSCSYADCAHLHASDYTNAAQNVEYLDGVLYIRDPPVYEPIDLVVPDQHRPCCPCPGHATNYVGVAYKSARLRLVDANGLAFSRSGTSCTVNLAGVYPSSEVGDATLAFARNGEVYRQYDKTVLGVSIKSNAVDLAACNALNAGFGYPMCVGTNLSYASEPDMKLVTNVRLPGGHVHLELSEATAPFTVWYYDRRAYAYRKLLDTAATPVKDLSMDWWKALMRRAADGSSNEMPVFITSPAPGRVKLLFRYWTVIDGKFVQDEAVQRITSVRPPLLVDYNRDGRIDFLDVADYLAGRLAYFWMNDDTWRYDDAFDTTWVGLLGSLGLQDIRNSSNGTVDGRCDLINFLPVAVDVGAFATNWNPNAVYYRLEADSSGVQGAKIAFADVDWARIGEAPFGTDCDIHGNYLHSAPVSALGAWTNPPPAFVSRTLSGSSTLLMEFPSPARYGGLRLKVYSKVDDHLLFSSSLGLHVGDVSQMVGWLNLRNVAGESGGVPTRLSTPDWPPEAHEPGTVVFVHGYNMEEDDETPLWAKNVFKKLWWAGLDRGFVAVQWRGNEGQVFEVLTPNYYGNVQNAFQTAPALSNAMQTVQGPKWFVAHSLGNMLVSAAIQDCGMEYEKYFMLNAAVAMEAFDPTGGITQESHDKMTPEAWTNYTDRVRSTHWFERFPEGDGRRLLTWKGRFANVTNVVNFYSSEEEVVNNGNGEAQSLLVRNYVWYNQETRKGLWPMMLHEYEGGWDFNPFHDTVTGSWVGNEYVEDRQRMSPQNALNLTDEQLRQHPFFLDFHNPEMHSSSNGLIVATNYLYRAEMLAYAIPSESFATGANPLPQLVESELNFNMASEFAYGRDDLPENGEKTTEMHRNWQHSTFVQRSYKRTHQLFKKIINLLKEGEQE